MTDYLTGFRNPAAARQLGADIREQAARLDSSRLHTVMEVCGSHTMAIARYALRDLLPSPLRLVSGPGCPVCVTDTGYIDAAAELARRGCIIATFGDMLYVPGTSVTLARIRAEGGAVEACLSPLHAEDLARAHPDRDVVFLAIGFETTIAPVVSLVRRADMSGLKNLSLLTAFKTIPPALHALANDPELKIDAFLCPAHVSAIIGANAYRPIVNRYRLPCVIAGFEPLDILLGIRGILDQWISARPAVENQYNRVVTAEGNRRARTVIETYLEPASVPWRGLGVVPDSGLRLKAAYRAYDAEERHGVKVRPGRIPAACRCGDVIKGALDPPECPLFNNGCSPEHPIGPCMVSAEGSCAAAYKYERLQ